MTEAPYLLTVVACKNVGEMADAEAHLGAEGRRQQFAGDLGGVDHLRRIEAIVAIAAMIRCIFAEVTEQDRPTTARGLNEGSERVQTFALGRATLRLDLLLDPLAGTGEVLRGPQ